MDNDRTMWTTSPFPALASEEGQFFAWSSDNDQSYLSTATIPNLSPVATVPEPEDTVSSSQPASSQPTTGSLDEYQAFLQDWLSKRPQDSDESSVANAARHASGGGDLAANAVSQPSPAVRSECSDSIISAPSPRKKEKKGMGAKIQLRRRHRDDIVFLGPIVIIDQTKVDKSSDPEKKT